MTNPAATSSPNTQLCGSVPSKDVLIPNQHVNVLNAWVSREIGTEAAGRATVHPPARLRPKRSNVGTDAEPLELSHQTHGHLGESSGSFS